MKETFTTAVDNQTAVDVHVLQGERELAADNRSLARFKIPIEPTAGRRAARRGHVPGRRERHPERHGDATCAPAASARVEVKPSYGLTDEEIERMLEESIDHAEEDVAPAPCCARRASRRRSILHATRDARASARSLEPGEAERIARAMAALEAARASEDYVAIRDADEALSRRPSRSPVASWTRR